MPMVELGAQTLGYVLDAWGIEEDGGPFPGLESDAVLRLPPLALSLAAPTWYSCWNTVISVTAGLDNFIQGAIFQLLPAIPSPVPPGLSWTQGC